MIYELTGEHRHRKRVSCPRQVIKNFVSSNCVCVPGCEQPGPTKSDRTRLPSTLIYDLMCSCSGQATKTFVRPSQPLEETFHSLLQVNRQMRCAALLYLDSNVILGVREKIEALSILGESVEPGILDRIRIIHVDFIPSSKRDQFDASIGFGSNMTKCFPNLSLLDVSLIPRNPSRRKDYHGVLPNRNFYSTTLESIKECQVQWDPTITPFLLALAEVKCRVKLHLLWQFDRDYFEVEYMHSQGWVRLDNRRQTSLNET